MRRVRRGRRDRRGRRGRRGLARARNRWLLAVAAPLRRLAAPAPAADEVVLVRAPARPRTLACLVPVVAKLRTLDPDLVKQLRRAAMSVRLNIAEGNGRDGRDRRHLFRVAYASAGEVAAALDGAVAFALVPHAFVADALALVDRVRAMTYRLATR